MKSGREQKGLSDWMRSHKRSVWSAVIGAVLVSATVFGWYGVSLYRERKATELMIADRYAEDAAQVSATAAGQTPETGTDASVMPDFSSATVEWQGKTYYRNTYVKAILCMGVDRKGGMKEKTLAGDGGQNDGVFLLAWDSARNGIKILMIPRDSITEITETDTSLTDKNGTELGMITDHLSLAYSYGDGREKSCEYASKAVSGLLGGLPIDSYMAADISVISVLNDAVGGVTVTIPTLGMEKADPAFQFGDTVHLMGDQAERFVRYRDIGVDNSAIARMEQQKQYIDGFFQAVRECSAKDAGITERLFGTIEDSMVTNLAKAEYLKIAAGALESGDLDDGSFRMVPGTGTATETYDEYYVDQNALTPVLLDLFYREA